VIVIKTVKQLKNGYKINDSFFVPNDINNRHFFAVKEWITNNDLVPLDELEEVRKQKFIDILQAYNDKCENDIDFNGNTFQADQKSINKMMTELSSQTLPVDFFWLNKNNDRINMTYNELKSLYESIITRNRSNFVKYQDDKLYVKNATSVEELKIIENN